ncbi:MAG: oxygen-independent coproporphyrinogen III oxidase [Bacteroidia bacterium]|nr:oxygen-independent coproporphyrinogen III oxidase [Bacteroidia bacterium]
MNLLSKYNIAAPRYTSYPTVPAWTNAPTQEQWKELVKTSFQKTNNKNGISIYIHLPFCESLCTYCACNTRITVNHKVEEPYLQAVLGEWKMYRALFDECPKVREIHLGGGTPTFFSPQNLKRLLSGILETVDVFGEADFSFEGHPSNTTKEHLQTLYDLGFRRVSYGIQDFDPVVQDVINRYQSFEQVQYVVEQARSIGYTSVNFDLVYGLPMQKLETIKDTINKVIELRPDRIAFYSYAHVPWIKPGQRKFTEKDLPLDQEKRQLYETGLELFRNAGYKDIGMDHFAFESDSLYKAMENKTLHRNFMGYTDRYTELMISLGVSAISDTWNAFAQNVKLVESYQEAIAKGIFPIHKGHVLNEEDLVIRRHILNIMCRNETSFSSEIYSFPVISEGLQRCKELERDELLDMQPGRLLVTEKGKAFLRNICLCFDAHYWRKVPEKQTFSTVA